MDEFTRKRILDKIEKDVEFLNSNDLMDYSLLLGVEQVNDNQTNLGINEQQDFQSMIENADALGKHSVRSIDGKFIYHVAIIDYLQIFNTKKNLEIFFKKLIGAKASELSSINPDKYATRFLKFMNQEVFVNVESQRKITNAQKILYID